MNESTKISKEQIVKKKKTKKNERKLKNERRNLDKFGVGGENGIRKRKKS